MLQLDDIFGAEGPLKRALPDFTLRAQQVRMAEEVGRAIESREALVIEAGTGTGKTFAYLVPALLCGARVLISTGTRTLQDQLFSKDLPLVAGALGRPARVALLKGRANYLCLHRLGLAGRQRELEGVAGQHATLGRIERWARITRAGDLAEVPGLSDHHPLWPLVTSTRDNCLGIGCAQIARCHVVAARRQAQEADIVIVNHHLLLADLALKEDGFGDLLGSADAVILDEAHQLPDLATALFGANVGSRRIENLLQAVVQENIGAVKTSLAAAEGALRELAARLPAYAPPKHSGSARYTPRAAARPDAATRLAWEECGPALGSATELLAAALEALSGELEAHGDSPGAAALGARVRGVASELARIAAVDELEGVRSVELSARGFALHLIPFDIAERFRALTRTHRSAWIFTSATLSVGEDFSHFTARLGLADAATLRIGSPFDFERQSLLYLPPGLPEPASPDHVAAVLDAALPLIDAAQGGAFLLFTSHRALGEGAALLRRRWGEAPPYRLYVQGESPREQLLQDFRSDGDGVLLGTASFWEGVDVKGDALRLVVIDKLPFASPEEPFVKARIDHIQASGGNSFRDFQLPEAALALKQGVGRLIRSESDYGAVVICDRRLIERGYGRSLLAALPPMRCTREAAEVLGFLRAHASARAAPRPADAMAR
ncbi:MAG: ATP-dependent DNA helicase [Steroidobacteraceae bacterium]